MLSDALAMDVYAVNLDDLLELIGSKEQGLLLAAKSRLRRPPWSEYKHDSIAWGKLDAPLVPGLDHLIMKAPAPSGDYGKYTGHAFRLLTSMNGKRLPVSAWNSFTADAFGEVDRCLRALGIPIKLSAQLKASPVTIPKHRYGPTIGHAKPDVVARTATALADAVRTSKSAAASGEACEMHKGAAKKQHVWTANIVGTDVVQRWRSPTGKEHRQVTAFMHLDGARLAYEGHIRDRQAEGYTIVTRTEPPKGGAKPVANVGGKALAKIEEATTWYAAAAKQKLGLVFFSFP